MKFLERWMKVFWGVLAFSMATFFLVLLPSYLVAIWYEQGHPLRATLLLVALAMVLCTTLITLNLGDFLD